jgi:small-conductance mechanosensitive channel
MIENAQVSPLITVEFNENSMNFTIRYVVDYKKRRSTKDLLFTKILKELKDSPDDIEIAYSTLEISQEKSFNVKIEK